ncbi:SAF domain-containing protein [Pedococcus dokdonensis]|uniref:SAF domain-containing protein n=1 Tax=Pedococcus dokdonensis TaxID=443156 RepID=UPI001E3AB21B|nr:SAF domain-containing protein [Pedococcus dokdonensis]
MTMTIETADSAAVSGGRGTPPVRRRRSKRGADGGQTSVTPAPKLRRRPVLVAASLAAVILGALLGAWTWSSTSNTHEVVALRQTVTRGETITQGDLMTVQVGVDPALRTLPSDRLGSLVGQRAAMDMAAGSLVTAADVTTSVLPGKGWSVVGVALPPSLMPGETLLAGDQVRIVATPGQQGDVGQEPPEAISATVVGLYPNGENGQTVVSVEVPQEQAAELAARAATGKVALVLDSRER